MLLQSVWTAASTGQTFKRSEQISTVVTKLICVQHRLYMSGQTGRELIDKVDSLDFSKCYGSTEGGDSSRIAVGFEQIKKNAIAHLMDQPFVKHGDTGSPLAGSTITRAF